MSDERSGGLWTLDPELRAHMRLGRVRAAADRGQWHEALLEVEELLDDEPDHREGLALLGHAALETGDAQVARLALEQYASAGHDDPEALLHLAVARFEMCDLVAAAEAAREVIRRDPANAEAHWYLGLSLERLPNGGTEAVAELAAARQLDPARYPWPLQLDEAEWERAIHDAAESLHPRIRAFWAGVQILLLEEPDLDELRGMDPPVSPAVSGLFQGKLDDDADPETARPEAMRLFRRNLALCRDRDELVEQIAIALEAEALGWLGIDDVDDLTGA